MFSVEIVRLVCKALDTPQEVHLAKEWKEAWNIAMIISPDDILFSLLLALTMMKRLEVIRYQSEDIPSIPIEVFDSFKARFLRAYSLRAIALVLKIVLCTVWYNVSVRLGIGSPWTQIGGALPFIAVILAFLYTWQETTECKHWAANQGIDLNAIRKKTPR